MSQTALSLPIDLSELPVSDLLALHTTTIDELIERKVLRSRNSPVADYAEYLVRCALRLSLATPSTKGYDAVDRDGRRVEVKARQLKRNGRGSRQLSPLRNLKNDQFDVLAGVLFNHDFTIHRACLVPLVVVKENAKYREHTNGWVMHLRDHLWAMDGVEDITSALKAAAAD